VHRDIKAQNVMREERGRVVLMDFGAGERVSDGRTKTTRVIGTPSYLAPEVLEGQPATVRADIYSLGILLFHLVTNEYPVDERTPAALIDAHRRGRVRRLRDLAPGLPSWFVQVIERAISPDPRDRFATAGEFEAALTRRTPTKIWPLLVAGGVTLAVAAGVSQLWTSSPPPFAALPLVALLPLEAGLAVSPQHAGAITEEIYQGLATIDTLRVVSSYSAAKAKRDNQTMTAIAKALGATAVVEGSVSDAEDALVVNLRLFRAGNEAPEWAQTFRIAKAGFGSLRRDSVMSIANTLEVDVSPQRLAQLTRSPNLSSQAFDAYASGRSLVERLGLGDLDLAITAFERTITLEPSFAPAYAALARAHVDIANGGPKSWSEHMAQARLQAQRAINLDPTLAEAHVVLGQLAFQLDWDWKGADAAFRRAIELNPSYDFARQCYSHFLAARGQVERAREELEEARRVNSLSETNDLELVPLLQYERRFPEAETLARSVLGRDPNVFQVYTQLGRIYAATGRYDQAIEQFLKLRDSAMGKNPYIDAEIASAHAAAGRVLEAETILEAMHERARTEEVPAELFALVDARLGRFDEAFHHLDQAISLKSRRILWLKVDPRWDPLRSDRRFEALVRRLGL
jgi:tetratricopeptide (TPR) repeat protein